MKLYDLILKNLLIEDSTGDYYLYYEPVNGKPLYLSGNDLVEELSKATRFSTSSEAEEIKKDFEEETGKRLVLTQFKNSEDSIRR